MWKEDIILPYFQIQLQQCKIDIEKKSNLIKEAIDAIDICEKKITLLEEVNSDLWEKIGKPDETKGNYRGIKSFNINYPITF